MKFTYPIQRYKVRCEYIIEVLVEKYLQWAIATTMGSSLTIRASMVRSFQAQDHPLH